MAMSAPREQLNRAKICESSRLCKEAFRSCFVRSTPIRGISTYVGIISLHRSPNEVHQVALSLQRHLSTDSGQQKKADGEPGASAGQGGEQKKGGDEKPPEGGGDEEKASPLQIAGTFSLLGFIGFLLFNLGGELFPWRMSPNTIFNSAHDLLKGHLEVTNHYGDPLKAYGMDNHGGKEGRRNHIEHQEYKAEDGSSRVRVRFNISGPYGKGIVYAEVSNMMSDGEWVYLMVQDARTGDVLVIHDNRHILASQAGGSAGGNKGSSERDDAMSQLLTGGGQGRSGY